MQATPIQDSDFQSAKYAIVFLWQTLATFWCRKGYSWILAETFDEVEIDN